MSGKNGLQTDKKRVSVRGSRLVSVQLGTKLLGRRAFSQTIIRVHSTNTAPQQVGIGAARMSAFELSTLTRGRTHWGQLFAVV